MEDDQCPASCAAACPGKFPGDASETACVGGCRLPHPATTGIDDLDEYCKQLRSTLPWTSALFEACRAGAWAVQACEKKKGETAAVMEEKTTLKESIRVAGNDDDADEDVVDDQCPASCAAACPGKFPGDSASQTACEGGCRLPNPATTGIDDLDEYCKRLRSTLPWTSALFEACRAGAWAVQACEKKKGEDEVTTPLPGLEKEVKRLGSIVRPEIQEAEEGSTVFRISVGAGCDESPAGRDVAKACKALGGSYGYPFGPDSDFCGCTVPKVPSCAAQATQEACLDVGGMCFEEKQEETLCHLKGGMPLLKGTGGRVVYNPEMRDGNAQGTCGQASYMGYSAEKACTNLGGTWISAPMMAGCGCMSEHGDLATGAAPMFDCAYIGGVASKDESSLCVPLGPLPLGATGLEKEKKEEERPKSDLQRASPQCNVPTLCSMDADCTGGCKCIEKWETTVCMGVPDDAGAEEVEEATIQI